MIWWWKLLAANQFIRTKKCKLSVMANKQWYTLMISEEDMHQYQCL
jgi:hypothetical protein